MTPVKLPSETRGIILMLTSVFFFAANTLAIRGLVGRFPEITGWHASLYRGVAGMLVVFFLYSFGRGYDFAAIIKKPLVIWRGVIGGFGIGLFYITVIKLGPGRASFIGLTYPVFAALLAHHFLKEKLSAKKLMWILLSFIGLGIFFLDKGLSHRVSIYDGVALLGSLLAGVIVILIKKLHATEHGSTIYGAQAFYGMIFALPISGSSTFQLSMSATVLLLSIGLLAAGGQLTMTFAYRHLEVSRGSSLQMVLPLVVALGSFALFGEFFGLIELIGAAITLGATWMINREASKNPSSMTKLQLKDS
ncbi:MAG: DMT family transporter [Akkermansiaceae bacterium]